MATAQDLIDSSLRKIGIKQPTTDQRTNALADLNRMIASWSEQRLLVYEITREMFTLTIGKEYYNLGPDRRIQLQYAYLRDGTQDYPLNIEHIKEYAKMFDKTQQELPTTVYFLQEPNARVIFDYRPNKAYQFYFASLKALASLGSLGATVGFTPAYERALVFNLAIELAPEYDQQLGADMYAIARDAREIIEGGNSQSIAESYVDPLIAGKFKSNILTGEGG